MPLSALADATVQLDPEFVAGRFQADQQPEATAGAA